MSSSTCDIAIVGGGIVGIATAMAITQRYDVSLVVLEAEEQLAKHQTGNNSGVIHSGLYYAPGSLKAQTCTQGREALYRFCRDHNIAHDRCGKVVVATAEEEVPRLERLRDRGTANGLRDLEILEIDKIREYEPHVTGVVGLYVEETGIVDYRAVTRTMAEVVREHSGEIRLQSPVTECREENGGFALKTGTGKLLTNNLINCGGLYSDRIARMCGADPGIQIVPFRGEYYELTPDSRSLVRNLIYPVPDPEFPFLGVHFTRMIDNAVEAGPNAVLALKREGYHRTSFSLKDSIETLTYPGLWKLAGEYWLKGVGEYYRSFSKGAFARALQKLIPEVRRENLRPASSGVRAQALGPDGELLDDFKIVRQPGQIHVLNAPSPAATASISIGEKIADMAEEHFIL